MIEVYFATHIKGGPIYLKDKEFMWVDQMEWKSLKIHFRNGDGTFGFNNYQYFKIFELND